MTTRFILWRSEVTGTVEAVQTSRNTLYGRKAIVIASGAWIRSLLHSFLEPALTLDIPVKPRKVYLRFLGLIFDLKIFGTVLSAIRILLFIVCLPNMENGKEEIDFMFSCQTCFVCLHVYMRCSTTSNTIYINLGIFLFDFETMLYAFHSTLKQQRRNDLTCFHFRVIFLWWRILTRLS